MAKRISKTDDYSQIMRLAVTMSGANTLTFSQLSIGAALFEYAAFIFHRIEYTIQNTTIDLMTATADQISVAITGSDNLTSLGIDQFEVYDIIELNRYDLGAAGNNSPKLHYTPIIKDFSSMPGGGLLVPAQDLYIAMDSTGLASAGYATARVHYTLKAMSAADYLELVQRMRVLST